MLALQTSEIKESFTAVRANRYRASWGIGQALSVYINLFWRAYLGAGAWSLYEALKTAVTATAAGWMEPPTISDLVSLVGQGDRYTILGRAATDSRPVQLGTLNALEDENIIIIRKTGVANRRKYHFGILMQLPILTPAQASQLPDPIQKKHTYFLGSLRGFDLPAWRRLDVPSFVLHHARENGRAWLGEDPYPAIPQPSQPLSTSVIQSALVRDSYNCRICAQTAVTAVPLAHGADHLISLCDALRSLKIWLKSQNRIVS